MEVRLLGKVLGCFFFLENRLVEVISVLRGIEEFYQ